MNRQDLNEILKAHGTFSVPEEVRAFALGWAQGWYMYVYEQQEVGNIEVDDFHGFLDWDLNLCVNAENLSLDVVAYPYIDEEQQADFSHFTRVVSIPLATNRNNNRKETRK